MCELVGCSSDRIETPGSEIGELTLRTLHMDLNTRSVNDLGLDPGTFKIEILDAGNAVVKTYPAFSDMPNKVRLAVGAYTVRASLGDPGGAGFGAWYFAGQKPVQIASGEVTSETIVCALANVKVAVAFGANLSEEYDDFSAEVRSGEGDPVRFAKEEVRAAYMPAGELRLTIRMTNKQGKQRTYTVPDLYPSLPQEFVTFKVDVAANPADLDITIGTDDVTDDREVVIRLYDFMNAKDAPAITADGFTALALTNREGVRPGDARVNLRADGVIRSCVVTPDAVLRAAGWPAEFDLADPGNGVAETLKALGLVWYERMDGAVLASLDLRDAVATLPWSDGASTPYTFTVTLADSFGQTDSETFTMNIEPPLLTLDAIPDHDMWASHVDVSGSFTGINEAALKFQYKTTGDWADCPSAVPTRDGQTLHWKVKELAGDTDYQFRMVYGNLETETRIARTEPAMQIPNGDFEDWEEYKYIAENAEKQWHLHPEDAAAEDKWWDTRNKGTRGMVSGYGDASRYTNVNTTSRIDNDGGYAAQLQTSSFGAGTTSSSVGCILTNVGAGFLFVGVNNGYSRHTYTYKTPVVGIGNVKAERFYNEDITQGHAFPSRPAKLAFDYMYAPYNSEKFLAYAVIESDGVEIARADATDTATPVESMTNATFDFVYTDKTKKATSIKIFFSSSDLLEIGIGAAAGRTPQLGPGEPTPTSFPAVKVNSGTGVALLGSKLCIDNVTLDYNFD